MPRVSLVTGAAGFVGQALVRRLLAGGDEVRAVVLPGDLQAQALRELAASTEQLKVVEADVTDHASLAPAFAGVSHVFHTAALVHAWASWERFRAVNVGGTQSVARAALEHGVKRLVAVSTTDVFGIPDADEVLGESSPYRPWNEPYPDTKIEAERWLWQFSRERGLPISVIYPGWVYGPGDRAFFPSLADAIAGGFMVFWHRGVRLDWVYTENLADACVLAAAHPAAAGNGYIVHDETDGPTLEEVCARIAVAIGAKPPTLHVPYFAMYAAASATQALWKLLRRKDTPPLLTVDIKAFGSQWHLSAQKVRRELGWTPRVPVDEGMRKAIEYLKQHRGQARHRG